jgi:hypothetical protein
MTDEKIEAQYREVLQNHAAARFGYETAKRCGMSDELCAKAAVIYMSVSSCELTRMAATTVGRPWCTKTGENSCSCHERDGSQVCEFCKSQGYRGHCE